MFPHPSDGEVREALHAYRPFLGRIVNDLVADGVEPTNEAIDDTFAHLILQFDPAKCQKWGDGLRCEFNYKRDCSRESACTQDTEFVETAYQFAMTSGKWRITG